MSLLDMYREKDGFIASILYRKYLYLLPEWHRRRILVIVVLVKASKTPFIMDLAEQNHLVEKLIAQLTEDSSSITLQQHLLDIANIY